MPAGTLMVFVPPAVFEASTAERNEGHWKAEQEAVLSPVPVT